MVVRFSTNGQKDLRVTESGSKWHHHNEKTALLPHLLLSKALFMYGGLEGSRSSDPCWSEAVETRGTTFLDKPRPPTPQKKSPQEAQRKSRLPRANRVREWGCDVIIRKLCPTAQLKATPKNNNKKRFSLRWLNLTVDQKLNMNKKHEKTKIKNMERLWRHWKLQNSNKNRTKKKKVNSFEMMSSRAGDCKWSDGFNVFPYDSKQSQFPCLHWGGREKKRL